MTSDDDDFPAPPVPRSALAEACDHACVEAVVTLEAVAKVVSREGAAWGAYDWLQSNSAGLPYVPMVEEAARDDARYWAETASPIELECYAFAALDRLQGKPFAGRQIKRMVASLWRQMSPTERAAFKAWIEKNDG